MDIVEKYEPNKKDTKGKITLDLLLLLLSVVCCVVFLKIL